MLRQVLFLSLLLCPRLAAAQSGSDAKIAANALFDEGKRLVAAGDVERACPKFEASLKLLDQLGVRLNLADCYEQQGKTATAWIEFREAASRADKLGDARAAFARQRAETLAPGLMKLRIAVVAGEPPPGLTVKRDGTVIPAESFGTALPVNPGSHTIEASASGYRTWSKRVDAKKPGAVVSVEIPALEIDPDSPDGLAGTEPATADGPQVDKQEIAFRSASARRQQRQRLGLVIGAGGVVALGAGVGLGFVAKSKWDSAGDHCFENDVCDSEGAEINRKARLYGNLGTVVGGVGVAAIITGAVLYVTAPEARQVLEHARLSIEPTGDGRSTVRLGFATRF